MIKDYFTALEAADYACVPLADFEALADGAGILSFDFMGQRVYRKADIQCAMERAWRLSTGGAVALPSTGSRRARGVGKASDMYPKPKAMGRAPGALGAEAHAYQYTPSPRSEHHFNELERIRRENETAGQAL